MFKAFFKKVEETTDKIGESLKSNTDKLGESLKINTDKLGESLKHNTDKFGESLKINTDKLGEALKIKEVVAASKEVAKPFENIIRESVTQIAPISDSIAGTSPPVSTLTLANRWRIPLVAKSLDIDAVLNLPTPPPEHYRENIDLNPGAALHKRYQDKLEELHTTNVELAKKAEAVDRKLPSLLKYCSNQYEAWRKLQGELARLPELSASVSNIRNQIDIVLVKFDELEAILGIQVEIYHANELTKYKARLVADNQKYQNHKQKELASLEEELATNRARYEREKVAREREQARIQQHEKEQQRRKKEAEENKQKEKLRSAFGSAFQHQMDQFKKFSTSSAPAPAPVLAKVEPTPVTPLESIVPEENPSVLEDFLKDSNDQAVQAGGEIGQGDGTDKDLKEEGEDEPTEKVGKKEEDGEQAKEDEPKEVAKIEDEEEASEAKGPEVEASS